MNSTRLREHIGVFHDGKTLEEIRKMRKTCEICQKVFPTFQSLTRHKFAMHGIEDPSINTEKVKCECCGKIWSTKHNLKKHLQNMETKLLEKFKCAICGNTFSHQRGLEYHENSVHKKLTREFCELCGKTFSFLKSHMLVVHEKRKDYKCDLCPFRCTFKDKPR